MRVLVASAQPDLTDGLVRVLSCWGHDPFTAFDGEQAWNALSAAEAPPLALLDWDLPRMDAPTLCRGLRAAPQERYTYLILVDSRGKGDEVLQTWEIGADDVLTYPLDEMALQLRLKTAEHILTLQGSLVECRRVLEYKSTHDALTGVWNRSEVLGMLEREMARCMLEDSSISVVMIDVDYFKQVNDRHGHLAGDAALREITRRLSGSIRPYDAIGRYGGEEFIVILPGCRRADSLELAERLRRRVCAEPVDLVGMQLPLTVSMGLAMWQGGDEGDMQALIRAADAALYRAKRAGRNCCEAAWNEPTSRCSLEIDPTIAAA